MTAFNGAFANRWSGFMAMTMARWDHQRQSETFDPRLSLVAWDDEEVAGFCHCAVDVCLNVSTGCRSALIRYVGGLRGWRRLGLGAALTIAGLHAPRDQGINEVVLEVDAESPTGPSAYMSVMDSPSSTINWSSAGTSLRCRNPRPRDRNQA